MLRFTQALSLSLHKKESRFSSDFWKGLGFAAAFHLVLFVSFKIVSPPNFDKLQVIIPTPVEIDLGAQPITAVLRGGHALAFPIQTQLPDSFTDNLQTCCSSYDPRPFYTKIPRDKPADFSELEMIPYEPLESILEEEKG